MRKSRPVGRKVVCFSYPVFEINLPTSERDWRLSRGVATLIDREGRILICHVQFRAGDELKMEKEIRQLAGI